MSSFVNRFLLFLIPIVVVCIGLEIYLHKRTSQNEILAKLELLDLHSDASVIFVGNSHGRNAFIPDKFDAEAINLCIGGSTSFYNLKLLERAVEQLPKLEYVVYNVSYQTLYYDLELLPNSRKLYEFFHYLGADAGIDKYSPDYFSILSTIGLKKAILNISKDISSDRVSLLETTGYKEEKREISYSELEESAAKRISAHHKIMNKNKFEANINLLQDIESLLSKHNIKLVYVILPVLESYEAQEKDPFDKFAAHTAKIASDGNQERAQKL